MQGKPYGLDQIKVIDEELAEDALRTVMALRAADLSDTAIHDPAAIVGYFNFVNRLASGLNVELEVEYILM